MFQPQDELEFKKQYAIHFLVSYDALNYQENCFKGWDERYIPAEDAGSLADSAWEKLKEKGLVREP